MAQQIAQAAIAFERRRTGRPPGKVTVVLTNDTLVITLHGVLSLAETALAKNSAGAARVEEFHQQLFANWTLGAGVGMGMVQAIHLENGGSMLVLSRKKQESVVVGGAGGFERLLKVKVLGIKGDKVRLGFEVDADIPVHRFEVWERILAEGGQDRMAGGTAIR